MSIDIGRFLYNVQVALANQHYPHAQFLLDHAITLAKQEGCSQARVPFDVSIGLDRGRLREANEDGVLVVQGIGPAQHPFGLFVVCDGMGGHARGQEAAHLAIQTMLESVLPMLERNAAGPSWECVLVDGIQQANRAIYLRNQSTEQADGVPVITSHIQRMGTTVTAVLLVGAVAYVANVGDSRTYCYDRSLKKITNDHSVVARLLADGLLQEEEIYVHPQRNQITRALGIKASVEVDTFVVPLQGQETLLLCSDGVWEMMRDQKIEEVLASRKADASAMTRQLVWQANENGGKDNIGCIVVRLQQRADVSAMETMRIEPMASPDTVLHAS